MQKNDIDAPAESRFRRSQQVLSPAGRTRRAPGMPLEMPEDEDDDLRRPRRRFDEPVRKWWRPASKAGRVFLALGVLTVLGSVGTCGWMAKKFLQHDNRFRIAGVSNIQAVGLTQVSREDILPVFGEDVGKNIFFVNLAERRQQLEQIPWIEHATVMRLLPDQIRVSVVERTPIAFVRQGQQIGLVDADGILLNMSATAMTQHHYSFPVVTGIDAGDPQPSRKERMAVYQRLIHDLDANGQHLSEQISEIDLTDPEDARVLMPEQGADILAHFGSDNFMERYQRYKAHIAEWRQQYPHLSAVDLRYEQQVVLQMAPGTAGATNAAAQAATTSTDGKQVAVTDDGKKIASPIATSTVKPTGKKPAAKIPARPLKAAHKPVKKPATPVKKPAAAHPVTHASSAKPSPKTNHATNAWDQ
jgi:cell division protein FtsQ